MHEEEKKLYKHALINNQLSAIKKLIRKHPSAIYLPLGSKFPIHIAAQYGHMDIVVFFYEQDKKLIHIKDAFEQTPVLWAAANGHHELLLLLSLIKADFHSATYKPSSEHHGWTALEWAKQKNHIACEELILRHQAVWPRPPSKIPGSLESQDFLLYRAARLGHVDVLQCLIACLIDREELEALYTERNLSLLHIAALHGHAEVVKYLMTQGLNPLLKSSEGKTALDLAFDKNHHDTVIALIIALLEYQTLETLLPYIAHTSVAINLIEYEPVVPPKNNWC